MKIITESPNFGKSFLESVGFEFPDSFREIKNLITGDSCLLLEGVTVYLTMTGPEEISKRYQDCPKAYVNVVFKSRQGKRDPHHYITTDLLTLYWCGWIEDLKYLSLPDLSHHELRVKIQDPPQVPDIVSKLKSPPNTYAAFLSDWEEMGNLEIIQKLKNELYIV